jgi:tyrosine-protein phosphatase YwqE
MEKIVDLHMHVVPGLDDGARNLKEALVMLCMAAELLDLK